MIMTRNEFTIITLIIDVFYFSLAALYGSVCDTLYMFSLNQFFNGF